MFGAGIGPAEGASFALVDSRVPFETGGTTVSVDGEAAPVLYAQDGQVNFIVPWHVRTGVVVNVCMTAGGQLSCVQAETGSLAPALFTHGLYEAAAVNQDGTINSEDHPAPRGSVVAVYLTGAGLLDGPLVDGAVAGLPLQHVLAPVMAQFLPDHLPCMFLCPPPPQPYPAEVLYAGSAPGLAMGVVQVNLRIPQEVPAGARSFTVSFVPPGQPFAFTGGSLWVGLEDSTVQ